MTRSPAALFALAATIALAAVLAPAQVYTLTGEGAVRSTGDSLTSGRASGTIDSVRLSIGGVEQPVPAALGWVTIIKGSVGATPVLFAEIRGGEGLSDWLCPQDTGLGRCVRAGGLFTQDRPGWRGGRCRITADFAAASWSITFAELTADWNLDGAVDVIDVTEFLRDWFAGFSYADFGGDGSVDLPDLFDFLGEWFASRE